jgi:transglutaminase/protease-like cytokinesis protein 3
VSERTLTIGNSFTLTATVTPANATNQKVSWTSSNEAVATVDASGKVTAVAAGNATITVTTEDGSKKATCTVTVTARIANTGTNVVPQTPVKDESANSVVVKDNVATVPDGLVEEILKDTEKGNPVTLPLTDNQKESVNTVFLTKDAVEQLAGNGTSIVLELTDASVSFDQAALTAIAAQAEGNDIEIRLSLISESELSDEQYQTVTDKEAALIVSANIYSDGQYIGKFNGGKATLAIPFTAEEGKEINNYKVYYVPENGELIEMNASYANGCFVFETTHYSEYAVI